MAGQAFVPIRCVRTGQFMLGRFVEEAGAWNLTEVRVSQQSPSGGADKRAHIVGAFGISSAYTGCPECGNRNYVRCNACGTLTCWLGEGNFQCVGCGQIAAATGSIDGVDADDLA